MKKTIILGMIGAGLFMSSCSKEVLNDAQVIQTESRLMFTVGLPLGEPVTYAQIHESDEYAIDRLDIFEFNSEGRLAKIHANLATTPAADTDYPARKTVTQITLDKGTTGLREFLFVANMSEKMQNDLSTLALNTTTKAAFQAELTRALSASDAELRPSFLMTGSKSVTISGTGAVDLTQQVSDIVLLTRAVARIDVATRLKTTAESMTITKVELENVPSVTSLYPAASNVSPASETNVTYKVMTGTALSGLLDNVATANYNVRYKKLFYPYERAFSQFGSKGTPTLYISADYKPTASSEVVKMRYKVPFDRSIIRNHLYTIVLGIDPNGSGDHYEGTASIMTLKWEEEHIFNETLLPVFSFVPNAALTNVFSFNAAQHEMVLKTKGAQTISDAFTVSTQFDGDTEPLEVLKSNGDVAANNSWITATVSGGRVTIQVEENTSISSRTGLIWFRSKKDTGSRNLYVMQITQPAH